MNSHVSSVKVAAGRLAYFSRRDVNNPEALADAKRGLRVARLERSIRDELAGEPALTAGQCDFLARILLDAAKRAR